MDKRLIEEFKKINWDEFVPKMLRYAVNIMRRHTLSEYRIINAMTADDLLQESINRLINGTRHWDPDKISLSTFLYGTMKSILSDGSKKEKRILSNQISDDRNEDPINKITDNKPQPDKVAESLELSNYQKQKLSDFKKTISDDKELFEFTEALEITLLPREIEDLTGIKAGRVSELKRKLSVKFMKYLNQNHIKKEELLLTN